MNAMNLQPIPQRRVLDKLDRLLAEGDLAAAERHLLYWMDEAVAAADLSGQLTLANELIGHYRKSGHRDEALFWADRALSLVDGMQLSGTRSAGTAYINAATACSAFGDAERALSLFEKARSAYENADNVPHHLLGSLYNNMAVCCGDLHRWDEANTLFDRAMDEMALVPGGKLEQAITCLNRADLVAAEFGTLEGETRINDLLAQAQELLADPDTPRNEYYAFVCEKCIPGFSYYGWFAEAENLKKEVEAIHERIGAVPGIL